MQIFKAKKVFFYELLYFYTSMMDSSCSTAIFLVNLDVVKCSRLLTFPSLPFLDHHGQDDMNNYISQYYSEQSSGEHPNHTCKGHTSL